MTIWVKREVLDTNNFTASTTELMRNPKVQSALSAFLVDQIYQNVNVKADLEKQLPKNLKGLAGPASAALNDYGTRAATRLLATSAVIDLVQTATRIPGVRPEHQGANRLRSRRGLPSTTGRASARRAAAA